MPLTPPIKKSILLSFLFFLFQILLSQSSLFPLETSKTPEPISILWVIPFIAILLSIAIFPLLAPKFWHKYYWVISLFVFGLPMFIVCLFFLNPQIQSDTIHEIQAYISFILLLTSLFTITGSIIIKGSFSGTPLFNTTILIIGTVLASFIGTTGASMLLIQTIIQANQSRISKKHIILFFIFTVSNSGGLLTPLGDPPLFLGYLRGVPFTWTLLNLFPHWLIFNSILIFLFFLVDSFFFKKENQKPPTKSHQPFAILGKSQILLILGVILSIYFQGYFANLWPWWPSFGPQESSLFLLTIISLVISPPKSQIRTDNHFSWFPIKEVAALFAGIFACMGPALYLLKLYGSQLGVQLPSQFFWSTGLFSAFLDNAPTYLVFLELAKSVLNTDIPGLILENSLLAAISSASVFMGALSYIGNAPNFMVKSIAEQQNIKMPSFFGYILYASIILTPLLLLITLLFFL